MKSINKKKSRVKTISYIGLISVMLVWGLSPIITTFLYDSNSASVCSFGAGLISVIALFFICLPHFKELNKSYFKVAIPTGIFYSIATLFGKIGLQYATPTQYQFLENLSCVVVPILLFIVIKKKPSIFTIIASALCLISSFILTGMIGSGFTLGIGQILCALAGILYGFNIVGTGVYTKKLNASLYVFIQMCVYTVVSLITTIALNFIKVDGTPLEAIRFSWELTDLLIILVQGVFFTAICWVIRTNVMKHVSATAVAIIMPFSAVVTGIVSVLMGKDPLSMNLIFGALIGLVAAMLSGLGDTLEEKRKERKAKRKNKSNAEQTDTEVDEIEEEQEEIEE